MPWGVCQSCGFKVPVQKLKFYENVSYFFRRNERIFEGYICYSCMWNVFRQFTNTTLLGTWWGLFGMFLGPIYIISNILNVISGQIKFWRELKELKR